MKHYDGMGYNDLLRNARNVDEYFNGKGKRDWRGLKMVGSWPDVNFWVDADGNIWEEYVPTYDW